MRIALWIVTALVVLPFGMAGFMKTFMPDARLLAQLPWIETTGLLATRVAGIAELLAAVAIAVGSLFRFKPQLVPLAALGLVVVMVLALGVHVYRGEPPIPNVILGGLAAFLAWGRWKKHPIEPRA
jgi:putative oxidoreductase